MRDHAGLMEEHRLLHFLAGRTDLVKAPLMNRDGQSVACTGDWTYEVHPVADGLDDMRRRFRGRRFCTPGMHGRRGERWGNCTERLRGMTGNAERHSRWLGSFSIFGGGLESHSKSEGPVERMEGYLAVRPMLRAYAEQREWRRAFAEVLMPFYERLEPWLKELTPLWTHNDLDASNLTWTGKGRRGARVQHHRLWIGGFDDGRL